MKRLVYTSKARRAMSENDITKILSVSRINNSLFNVSGMLLYRDGTFLQVLEGNDADLSQTYARIRKDRRHYDCRLLVEEAIIQRAFRGWEMAYREHSELLKRQQLQLLDIAQITTRTNESDLRDNPALYVFLKAFLSSFERHRVA